MLAVIGTMRVQIYWKGSVVKYVASLALSYDRQHKKTVIFEVSLMGAMDLALQSEAENRGKLRYINI